MKKAIMVGLALILMLTLLISCGVPQEEFDKVSSDLAASQTQIQSLQGELSAKETELSAKQSELEATREKLEQGKARIEILNALFIPAITGELDEMTETEAMNYFFEWRDKIKAVEDPVLTAEFQTLIDSGFSDQALTDFFIYLLESIPEALE